MSISSAQDPNSLWGLPVDHRLVDSLFAAQAAEHDASVPLTAPVRKNRQQRHNDRDIAGESLPNFIDKAACVVHSSRGKGDLGNFENLWKFLDQPKDIRREASSDLERSPRIGDSCKTNANGALERSEKQPDRFPYGQHRGVKIDLGDHSDSIDTETKNNSRGQLNEDRPRCQDESLVGGAEGRRRAVIQDFLAPPNTAKSGPPKRILLRSSSGPDVRRASSRTRPRVNEPAIGSTEDRLSSIENPQSPVSKRRGLVSLLRSRFPEDTKRLDAIIDPSLSSRATPDSESPIHVFVDLSNVSHVQPCVR